MLALDTETTLASNAEPIPQLVSVSVCFGEHAQLFHALDPKLEDYLYSFFQYSLACFNAPFDMFVLARAFPALWPQIQRAYETGRILDGMTREKLIDIATGQPPRRYDLASVAKRRCGLEVDKTDPWRLRYSELLDLDLQYWPREAIDYAITDARTHYAVVKAQEKYREYFQFVPDLARRHLALYAQTLRGIETDQDRVAALTNRLDTEIEQATRELLRIGLVRWQGKEKPEIIANTKVAQQLMAQWCTQKGLDIPWTPKGGWTPSGIPQGVSLTDEALVKAGVPENHPLAIYRKRKATQTLRNGRIPTLQCPLIRTRYDECKDTARTGSSAPQGNRPVHELEPWEWVGDNLQNQPKTGGFRECLKAREGHVFVISDWGGAELVTNAQNQLDVLGSAPLADAIRKGINAHTEIASMWLGINYEAFDKENPDHVLHRNLAKMWNFGRFGGMGDNRFLQLLRHVLGLDWPVQKVREYNYGWKQRWQVDRYFQWVQSQPHEIRIAQTGKQMPVYTMRHYRTGFIKGGCTYTEACNFPFQHLAAACSCTALWQTLLAGIPQVLFVHDELVAEVPKSIAEETLARQERIMIEAFGVWCPDIPITVESKITERYSK